MDEDVGGLPIILTHIQLHFHMQGIAVEFMRTKILYLAPQLVQDFMLAEEELVGEAAVVLATSSLPSASRLTK